MAAANGLYICAEHVDPEDWQFEFHKGAVLVPSGTVFDYAGHIIGGNLQDPKDDAHWHLGWKGISKEEQERRDRLIAEDMSIDRKNTSAVVTTKDVKLTAAQPCAMTSAKVVLSRQWGWTVDTVAGDPSLYYQAYGAIRRGALDTNFADDKVPFNQLAARGQLSASVRGAITQSLNLDEWSTAQPPDEKPVQGHGNAGCWGDDNRQDITCRALTENFLISMEGATKDEVVKAMNVNGRDLGGALHYISNYSRGERWGSGFVNFSFNGEGRVSVIYADLDPPNMKGKSAEFIWNAAELPAGCSDLPGTHMKRCN